MNWTNISLFINSGTLPTLKLPIKNHLQSRWLFFSDVVLVWNYHGCKGEAIKLIPYYMIDITYKTVKSSHLKKLQVIHTIKNLMFQFFFMFFWLNFEKTNHSFLHPFLLLGEADFWKNAAWGDELLSSA